MRSACGQVFSLALALCLPGAACAFDCAKASTASKKAFAPDPAARAADDAMAQAYSDLLAAAAPASRPEIVEAQSAWLTQRDKACAEEKGRKLAACLTTESGRRRAYLAGEPEAGPGAPGR